MWTFTKNLQRYIIWRADEFKTEYFYQPIFQEGKNNTLIEKY